MKVNQRDMRTKIKRLIAKDPTLADDDKRLIANIWWQEGWRDPELYNHIKSVSSPETIRRTRAKLVQDGEITVSSETAAARKAEETSVRKSLRDV